jgi:FKBP-type peptidyl-prolyl cis-trans isomerase FkpA
MNSSSRLVIILVAVAAAFGAGWYVGHQGGSSAATDTSSSSSASASAPTSAALPSDEASKNLQVYGWIVAQRAGVKQFGLTSDEIDQLAAGMKLALTSGPTDVPGGKDNVEKVQQYFEDRADKVQKAESAKEGDQSTTFFANLDKNPDIKKTDDGLYYQIITAGDDTKPKPENVVVAKYKGTFIDGTVFDQTDDSEPTREFPLNGVIPAWTEGLQLIGKGGEIKLYVPAKLGYGDPSQNPAIPSNATLIFDITLVDIKPPAPADAGADAGGASGLTPDQIQQLLKQAKPDDSSGAAPPPGSAAPAAGDATPAPAPAPGDTTPAPAPAPAPAATPAPAAN